MPKLRKLRLGNNKLVTFDQVPTLPNLQKLDIKENQVAKVAEFGRLKFPNLFKIIVTANPCAEELGPGIKTDILILFEDFNIKFINKEEVTKEERDEAMNVKNERIKKEAEEREERLRQEKEKQEEEEKLRLENEEKMRLEKEEEERQRKEKEDKDREEEEKNKQNMEVPDMKDLGNISGIDGGIDGGINMEGGDFDEQMGD
jgi:Leucine Rich repeats (2 copies)